MNNDQEFLSPGRVNYLQMNVLEALLYVCTAQGSTDLRIRKRGTCEVCVSGLHTGPSPRGKGSFLFALHL